MKSQVGQNIPKGRTAIILTTIGQALAVELDPQATARCELATDEFMRLLGFYRVAEANYRALPSATQQLFESYAGGVNAALSRDDSLLPSGERGGRGAD